MRSAYEILGVDRNASIAEIRRAYRSRARETHPDQARGGSEAAHEAFLALRAAYRILVDADARRAHDRWLAGGGRSPASDTSWDESLDGGLKEAIALERRRLQRERRKNRLRRLYRER